MNASMQQGGAGSGRRQGPSRDPSDAGHGAEDARSLPAWIYRDPEFFELEKERVFRPSWQLVCHVSDIPNPGDYHRFDFLGEAVFSVRGDDRQVRSFHNVCRHRAGRLLDAAKGHCARRIVCPYHAWSYTLDGRLASIPQREHFAGVKPAEHGLVALQQEIFLGFVFVRLGASDGPSVAEMAAPYAAELAAYRLEDLTPQGRVTLRPRSVNWKNVADNYSDGLHIPVAHPGLTRLFADTYRIEAQPWIDRMSGEVVEQPATPPRRSSEWLYQRVLPRVDWLSPERNRRWVYFKLWPNVAFDIYPDQVDFMQFLPVSATQTVIREIAYVHRDARREMRAARYLNWRINRRVNVEDKALIERVQAGMNSGSYSCGPLGDNEVCLRSFSRRMRNLIPACRNNAAPARGWSAQC